MTPAVGSYDNAESASLLRNDSPSIETILRGMEGFTCLGAWGKSEALRPLPGSDLIGALEVGLELFTSGEVDRPRALPIYSWALAL